MPVEATPPQTPPPLPRATQAAEEEPEEISEEEAQEIADDLALDAAPTPPHPRARVDEPEEISSDEVEEADAADAVEAADDQVETADDAVEPVDDDVEPVEAGADAVEAVDDDVEPVEDDSGSEVDSGPEVRETRKTDKVVLAAVAQGDSSPQPEPPPSALDPWFAQLAHGYCPPEGAQFARHTPPTNFPGRDEDPTDSPRVPPPPTHVEGAPRGKRS
jgi:hypothetical protein